MNTNYIKSKTNIKNTVKFILHNLEDGEYKNLHYVSRKLFLNNINNKDYVKKITNKTKYSKERLITESQFYLLIAHKYLQEKLNNLSDKEIIQLYNDEEYLNNFLLNYNERDDEVYKNDPFL